LSSSASGEVASDEALLMNFASDDVITSGAL